MFQFSSVHLFAFISSNIILITILIIYLAGSPGSYFAYLKDCLKEWRKKLECTLSMAEHRQCTFLFFVTSCLSDHKGNPAISPKRVSGLCFSLKLPYKNIETPRCHYKSYETSSQTCTVEM